MNEFDKSTRSKPSYVLELETIFGGPSQSAFGSALFFEPVAVPREELEQVALAKYRYFVGECWERFGPEQWLGTWTRVYTRPVDAVRDLVAELNGLTDSDAQLSASTFVEGHEHPRQAQAALSTAFDDAAVALLDVYKIGDGEAMSGLLIAASRPGEGSLFLTFLMD